MFNNPYDKKGSAEEYSPKNLQVSIISLNKIKLSWTKAERASDVFYIERRFNGGNWEELYAEVSLGASFPGMQPGHSASGMAL